ncbi:hypothetical protein N7462_007056 [Penicillium macrosclerotiorum]|uniref:uncharacterized protein n=1 Tax=Penicillium macrosclerotiorum TaxID=303699 RepID=UPI002549951C|nr:uncharacterized protein N7462_007056 [Penicillium macrosclerotiorum]KAJ5678812.1 hypothetical protein N7462_007056 [Penicillium macrosclerotiorum]
MSVSLTTSIRRSVVALSSSTLKAPTRQTTSATLVLRCGGLSATNRGLSSVSQRRGQPTLIWSQKSRPLKLLCNQARQFSDKSDLELRQWGFEEITSTLPNSDTSSPTHTPVILVDVREPAELSATGIIPNAISIPLASQPDAMYLTPDEFETRFGFPKPPADGDGQLVFYCKAGVRARAAAQMAVQAGYDPARVGVYDGSWLDWAKKGGKVERWEGDE